MRRSGPTDVIADVVNRFVASGKDATRFLPSEKFQGPKQGWYFSSGPQGTGYYEDAHQEDGAERAEELSIVQQKKAPAVVLDAEELLREAEEQAGEQVNILLDSRGMKRLVVSFERKHKENMAMRMKYADQPERFMDSEVDLDVEVKRLGTVASNPELYPEFVSLGPIPSLLQLVTHENPDISYDVVKVLSDLTDPETTSEDAEGEAAQVLADALIEANGLEILVQRLLTLVESEGDDEQLAVFHVLSTIDNLVDIREEAAEIVFAKTRLCKWLLNRLKPREFDSNKQMASELLSILLQDSEKNQAKVVSSGGLDTILEAIAQYKNRNPEGQDEEEHLGNLFNALCSCLMTAKHRTVFCEAEGVELMLLVMKARKGARGGALKALDFATTGCPPACEKIVDNLGLKTVFSTFMGKTKRRKGEEGDPAEEEERSVSIISNLLQGVSRGTRRDRICAKFLENEFEKCDRLMELYDQYENQVTLEATRAEAAAMSAGGDEDEVLLARMGAGLFTLQRIALIFGHLWLVGDTGVMRRLLQLLHQNSRALGDVRAVLREFHDTLGTDGSKEESERQQARVKRMLLALGEPEEAAEEAPAEAPAEPIVKLEAGVKPEPSGKVNGGAAPKGEDDMDLEEEAPRAEGHKENGAGAVEEGEEVQHSHREHEKGREDAKEKEGGKSREKGKDRDRDRDRERERGDRGKEKDKDREKDREKSKHRSKDERSKDERREGRDRDRDRDRDADRDRDRERARDKESGREKERAKDYEKDHSRREKEKRRSDGDIDDRRDRKKEKRDR